MTWRDYGELRAYEFETLPVLHGFFTRRGGVSPAPWESLNHGGTVGDIRANVVENRRRVFAAIGRPVESIFDVWQVHSATVVVTDAPRPLDQQHQPADAIITNNPEITLMMRFADCVPVMFYDPKKQVVGIAHAGWQGTVKKIASATVLAMQKHYGCLPDDIWAGIGPSIGPDHYEVGPDVIEQVRQTFGAHSDEILISVNSRTHLNLWLANKIVLNESGVNTVSIAGECTACHLEDWYSHRGEHGKAGRFGAVLALEG